MSAVLIEIKDSATQQYLQKFPFLNNLRDAGSNRKAFQAVKNSLRERGGFPGEVVLIKEGAVPAGGISDESGHFYREIFDGLGVSRQIQAKHLNDYYWKTSPLKAMPVNHILSIGCGDGIELIFLRERARTAKIVAMDWERKVDPRLLAGLDIDFQGGNIFDLLDQDVRHFDVIFSNHFMEHLYAPEELLHKLFDKLNPGGMLVSAMPMDGAVTHPFFGEILRWVKHPEMLHALDFGYLDPGHPWKTNPEDLLHTLKTCGFRDIDFYQRSEHLTRTLAWNKKQLASYGRLAKTAHAMTFGIFHKGVQVFFPGSVPAPLTKAIFAVESRIAFGSPVIKNAFSPEILFVAKKLV